MIDDPTAIIGEIGLDGLRWRIVECDDEGDGGDAGGSPTRADVDASDETTRPVGKDDGDDDDTCEIANRQVGITMGCANHNDGGGTGSRRVLSCPMDVQKRAFVSQLLLATTMGQPVSVHVVNAWKELFDSFNVVRETMVRGYEIDDSLVHDDIDIAGDGDDDDGMGGNDDDGNRTRMRRGGKQMRRRKRESRLLLPPKIYFHAFSGKAGILSSIFAACDQGNVPRENVYFGFAPVSPPPSSSFSHVSSHLVYRLNILYPPFVLSSPPLSLPSLSLPPPHHSPGDSKLLLPMMM